MQIEQVAELIILNRRKFIRTNLIAGAGFLAYSIYPQNFLNMERSREETENLIIGSGYGGAVAALRLTQAGKKVSMLEMGVDWEREIRENKPFSNMITPKNNSTWLRNKTIAPMMNMARFNKKFTGALDRKEFQNIKVYLGRGVGGGSIVNGGMAVLPKKSYFKEIFPDLNVEDFWNTWFPKAQKELEVNEIPEEFLAESDYYKFARVGIDEARNAGFKTVTVPNVYSFEYMRKEEQGEVPKSALAKEVIYGNNHGKQSLDKTYLKKARETGLLSILDLHRVTHLEKKDSGYDVYVDVINTSGEIVEQKIISCKKLFLNAGSLGTTGLLLASKSLGNMTDFDSSIGKNWGNNGNIMAGRNMVNTIFNRVKDEEGENYSIGTGSKQSTIPVAGVDHWDAEEHPFFAEISPLPMGMEVYTALYLLINRVPHYGEIVFDENSGGIDILWEEKHYSDALENARYFIKRMNKANGGTPSGLLWKGGYGPDICYHPLGGAVLGKSTDLFGRVKGYNNLYVTDGALVPASIGVNPFLTITALAEYCMDAIIREDF